MRKLFILTAVLVIGSMELAAQRKLHAFLFCKTTDPSIGKGATANYADMLNFCETIAGAIGYDLVDHSLISQRFEKNRLLSTVRTTRIDPTDIVIIYYSTHGAKSVWDKSIFPQVDVPSSLIPSYTIHKEIAAKKPKAVLSIVEACSGYLDIKPQQAFLLEQSAVVMEPNKAESRIKGNINLLFNSTCNIIVCAGQPGMNTWATDQGSIFTKNFLRAFNEVVSNPFTAPNMWDTVLNKSQRYTSDFTKTTRLPHYPVWEKQDCSGLTPQTVIVNEKPVSHANFAIKVTPPRTSGSVWPGKKKIYNVEFSISGTGDKEIDSVTYYMHYTMPKPTVTVHNKNEKFRYTIGVWGEFQVKAKVHFSDGEAEEYYKHIEFPKK
ncbi:MAG TPA: pYEATS domain-containing protein [Anaerovoracaceae bacterium]|nr:pYEATS domain-containing protein [Anaerovoracaceae bacterium]